MANILSGVTAGIEPSQPMTPYFRRQLGLPVAPVGGPVPYEDFEVKPMEQPAGGFLETLRSFPRTFLDLEPKTDHMAAVRDIATRFR